MPFSVRIVNADLYTAAPLPGFDSIYSSFRESKVIKVPVIRIFGSTPSGQKTCLHVHGVFPYIYIPYDGSQPTQNYLKQFATSVDFAVHVSMGKASSSTRHIHDIVIVKARPYYGYHEEEREFMKISFYNPFIVSRVVSLLQNGAIMNKVFQPHEAHIPYIQQMFIDYNLYGMNLLHASAVKFRSPLTLKPDDSYHTAHVPDLSPSSFSNCKTTQSGLWSEKNIPSHWMHDPEVERLSISELEVDVKVEDILNQNDIESSIGTSPGLVAIWEEERERRRNENDGIPLSTPVSQDRGDLPLLEAEAYYKEKIQQIIGERDLVMQTSPVHHSEGETPSSLVKRNAEQDNDSSPSYHNASVNEPIVDESIVQEVVQSSQQSLSQDLVSSADMEMVKILVSLEEGDDDDDDDDVHVESRPSQSLTSPILSIPHRELLSGEEEAEAEEAEQEEEESILMSQQVWDDTDPFQQQDTGQDKDSLLCSQVRVSQFDLEGLEESWEIPQLDGVNDDDTCMKNRNNRHTRTTRRLGMSSIRIPIKPFIDNDKRRQGIKPTIEGNYSEPSNEPATFATFSLKLSETSSSENENTEEDPREKNESQKCDGREREEGNVNECDVSVCRQTKESRMSYKAIKSLVFAEYSKSSTRKVEKEQEKKYTKVKNAAMGKSNLPLPSRRSSRISNYPKLSLKEDGKEQNRRYDLRNTKQSCLKIADSPSLSDELSTDDSETKIRSHDEDGTLLHLTCADNSLAGNSIPSSRQGYRTNLRDLNVVLEDVAFSEDLRDKFVAAVNRKKFVLKKSKPKTSLLNFPQPISSSGNGTKATIAPCKPTLKKRTSPKKSPKSKRYGVLDITVHTSPSKDMKAAISTGQALPIRRRLDDQLEHTDIPLEKCSRKLTVTSGSLGYPEISNQGVKRKSFEIHSRQNNKKRLSLRLKKKSELTTMIDAKKDPINTEDESMETKSIGCELAVPEGDDNKRTLNKFGVGNILDDEEIRHQVTCIPSSPVEDVDQSHQVVLAPILLQQSDTGLLNSALFNMSFLSPRTSEWDTSSSPPSPFTPTTEHINDSCKSITDRQSAKLTFGDSSVKLPDDGISNVSEAENHVHDQWGCQSQNEKSQMEETSTDISLSFSNEVNRTQDKQKNDEPMNTLGVSSCSTKCIPCNEEGVKDMKITCLNALRQQCLLLKNTKRALLGITDEEELSNENDYPVTTRTSKELSTQGIESHQHTESDVYPISKELSTQGIESHQHSESDVYPISKDLSAQGIESHQHTESDVYPISKDLSAQGIESHQHTESDVYPISKELSAQGIESHQHTGSPERETDEEERRLFSGSSPVHDHRLTNSFSLLDDKSSVKSIDISLRNVVVLVPERRPPTTSELMESVEDYGIPQCRHQQPFYSNPDDAPETTMDVGGRLLKVQSQTVKSLPEFDTRSPVVGLKDWRQLLCAAHECQHDMGGAEGFLREIESNPRLRLAFMDDKPIVLMPCKIPPSPMLVSSWAKEKLMKYKQKRNRTDELDGGQQVKLKEKLSDDHAGISDTTHQQELTSPDSLFSPTDKTEHLGEDVACGIRESSPTQLNQHLGSQPQDRCDLAAKGGLDSSAVTCKELCPSTPSGQLRPCISSAPQHSTPILSHNRINPSQLPILTPIVIKALDKPPEEKTERSPGVVTTQTRRQLIPSQLKFVTPDNRLRCYVEAGSDIEGTSPINTGGFKVPQLNIQDSKPSHEVQHLTLLSIELHVRTRKDLRPDPEFDPICAIFYHAQTDSRLPAGKNQLTGIICAHKEPDKKSTEKRSSGSSLCTSSIACQEQENRRFLERSGVTKYVTQYVEEEKELFGEFLQLVRKWDPDILIGYEVQMLSWGYLIQRALVFDVDLCKMLSRVTGSSSECNMDAENDKWGAAHTSELKIPGRIVLNVWRLMRHEVALTTYTFENVAFHVLHERIPLFTYCSLSDWWDHKIDLHRWRTVNHYITRCHGNIRILEQVDFIGRTSELARLFGILFYSVISRGSQFRVESMMLRISKPMNYVPLSPSREQIRSMRAPEVIPLVLEPESRFYSDPVLVLDFQSLYPSMVIAYNYCYSTCLGRVAQLAETGEFKFGASSLSVPSTLLKKIEDNIHVSPNGVAFVKPGVRRGVLPRMLEDILNTRVMVKNSMKKWKSNKSVHRMLDARQLGLKLIANVTFGYTAAHFSGRMPCVEIGDSIIRKARETLEYAINLVNNTSKWGARVVYGDTDSMFVLLKGVTKEEAFRIGQEIVDTVTSLNPKPVKLKFEKVYLPCVLQTKKRYVGYMYETLDQKEPVFDAKGIETVRRDTCPAVAKVLEKSLRIMFETKDVSLVKRYVQRQFTKVFQGRISLQDLTFAKEYRGMSSYKPGACVPALELTRRMLKEDRRSEPRVGERVPYVVTYGTPGLPLIRLVKRPLEVLQDPNLRINAMYYITKQMIPPLNRIFTLIGIDVNTWFADVPRIARVRTQPFAATAADIPKKTISHYFYTTNCPVCQEVTTTGLCETCSSEPQKVLVMINDRLRKWRRTYHNLTQLCYQCCASADPRLCCVSIDCPVFHKLIKSTRDLQSEQYLRQLLEGF